MPAKLARETAGARPFARTRGRPICDRPIDEACWDQAIARDPYREAGLVPILRRQCDRVPGLLPTARKV